MATITSNGTGGGNWGTGATWAGGVVPANNETVVIASGDTVIFNVDQSGFADGMDGMTITGTLKVSTSTSSYMKMKAATLIVGAGTFNIGESGAGAIPFAVKFTLTGGAGWYIDGNAGLTMTVYGTEPTNKYIKLSGEEALGQTELGVNADVTGDIWAAGDTISINNINKAVNFEYRVIDTGGIATDHIDITVGLTAAKIAGSLVILVTRNVQIISDVQPIYRVSNGKFSMGSGLIRNTVTSSGQVINECTYATITGGVICGGMYSLYRCHNSTVSNAILINAGWGIRELNYVTITNCLFSGNTYECYLVNYSYINGCSYYGNRYSTRTDTKTVINNCYFEGNSSGLYSQVYPTVTNCVFVNNTRDIESTANFVEAYNTQFNSTVENYDYALSGNYNSAVSEDHDGNDGALKVWGGGGVVTSQTSVKPTGYTQAYLHALASATYICQWQKNFSVEPGKTVSIEVQLRKDASMTYLPRVYLMASIGNPLAGATAVDSFTMTDSTDTWETDTFSITNSTDYDQDYTLWFVGKNASGNVYSAYDITTAGGTGGGLLTHPSMTGGMRG